jgi:hypothetical protein
MRPVPVQSILFRAMQLYGSPFLLLVTHPLPWIRSVPLRNVLPFARTSRIMSTMGGADNEEGLFLSKPSPSDVSITDNTKDPVDLEKYKEILRKVVGEMCRDMSPQEAFEFCLRSRFDYRYVPYGTDAPPLRVEQGLTYHVRDADWLTPDGEEIRKFVEDDDRYCVDWGNLAKDNGSTVEFMPEDPLPHMLNEKNDSSYADPNGPSDPRLLEKANALVKKTRRTQLDRTKDFYKKLGEICLMLSPRDSFTVRLESRSVFEEGARIYQYELGEDEEEEIFGFGGKNTDMFDIYNSNCFNDPKFKHFLKNDGRYRVKYIISEMCKETRAAGGKGTIGFVPNSPRRPQGR